jgi:hypothetical protein
MTRTPNRSQIRTFLLAAMLGTASATAFAQATMPRVDAREQNQAERIGQGIASGSVTPREAVRLENGQQRIERMEHRAEADGTVTRRERLRLHDAQQTESRRVFRQKHDAQQRMP